VEIFIPLDIRQLKNDLISHVPAALIYGISPISGVLSARGDKEHWEHVIRFAVRFPGDAALF
jgi:hypothetical protein